MLNIPKSHASAYERLPQSMQNTIRPLLVSILLMSLVTLASCVEEGVIDTSGQSSNGQESALELVEWQIEKDEYGENIITGVVVNNTSDTLEFVSITFGIWDSDKEFKIEDSSDYIDSLNPGDKWKFNVVLWEAASLEEFYAEPIELSGL